jgi:large subunit ribosomal protein L3
VIDVSLFAEGELVDITGISKGRGFAGAVKRHHFHGGPKTHGQSDRTRAVGAIGSGTTPGHIVKGLRAPGHMGNRQATILNQLVAKWIRSNLIAVQGAVPGPVNGLLFLRKAAKTALARKKRALHL